MEEQERKFEYFDSYPDPRESAEIIVPILLELIGTPRRVVDLGGGVGAWGEIFRTHGVERYVCIDDSKIPKEDLRVPVEDFIGHDLGAGIPGAIKSDLAVCLEFAEHVQRSLSKSIVRFLTASAPVVLFAASIPGQPGLNHINEQPPLFWKDLFEEFGYQQLDLIRPRIIEHKDIPYWYRQNIFVYANKNTSRELEKMIKPFDRIPDDFELVHERILKLYRNRRKPVGLRRWIQKLPEAIRASMKARS